ncbi:ABC-2 transporter permease [Paenibacillus sp. FSL P2-0089]|uniref:ABC-2 transporter permease n=1 Tax=unclassified Paenibacillus TaxID=185978 RepID=UPI000569A139|nr:ABC-2 transporter permease [Paenibacillus sp. FSL R7-277]
MRGLLLNNYYSLQNNIKSSLGIALLLALVSFVGVEHSVLNAVIAAQIMLFVVSIGASLQADEASKWNRFEITLPVRRRTVIHAKYLSFLMLILMGTAASLVTMALLYVRGVDTSDWSMSRGYTFGLALSLSILAIYYPVILKFGIAKSEQMLMVSVGLSMGLRFLVWMLLNLYMDDVNFNGPETGYGALLLAVLLFIASYVAAVRIHRNKEF